MEPALASDVIDAADYTLGGLRPFPVAITTVLDGRANGLMSLSAGTASIIREAPRVTVGLTKYNLTHDMTLASGVFAMHLLCADDDIVDESLNILMTLGGRSGRDGDKLGGLRTKVGVTGVPILLDTLAYVEARVCGSLDNEENTIFVGDVVASERFRPRGKRLDIGAAWKQLPPEWITEYDHNHEPQLADSKRRRGIVD
ncbi:MAG TPA: flavin reductase family protein [Acidimicrobiia bacterium]|nr:flavin reductase family protein [Acidimicrobiia bacterium]